MSRLRVRAAALVAGAALLLLGPLTGTALAAGSGGHVSFTTAQQQFECTICHEPLNEARSSEAYEENALLRRLIARGDTLAQMKRIMVAEYGAGVLAVPPAHGFGLFAFLVPGAIIALGLGLVAVLIPRWRRRAALARPATAAPRAGPAISDADAERLDAELARQP